MDRKRCFTPASVLMALSIFTVPLFAQPSQDWQRLLKTATFESINQTVIIGGGIYEWMTVEKDESQGTYHGFNLFPRGYRIMELLSSSHLGQTARVIDVQHDTDTKLVGRWFNSLRPRYWLIQISFQKPALTPGSCQRLPSSDQSMKWRFGC